ncbi:MAG: LysM peptidoglycan-binding domain-containing protein [Actinomycetes bacterium]
MTTDLDRAVRSSLGDIIATAPQPDDNPARLLADSGATSTRRPYLAVAASLVVLAGVGGLVAIGANNDAAPIQLGAATDPVETSPATAETTTTLLGQTTLPAVVNPTPNCSSMSSQSVVPNVAGMSWVDAADALLAAGLAPNALPELPGPSDAPDADLYVIIRQATIPGTTAPCGTTVDITVAYQPGTLYVVQDGDTYQSIAASQGITLEQLLGFQGLSVAELAASGRSPSTPLALGQALRLSACPSANAPAPQACSGPSSDLDTNPSIIDPTAANTAATTTTLP